MCRALLWESYKKSTIFIIIIALVMGLCLLFDKKQPAIVANYLGELIETLRVRRFIYKGIAKIKKYPFTYEDIYMK